jgi:hypothetical protein
MNQELKFGTEIFYNENQLLSLAISEYNYTGGAHGLLRSQCMSFDLRLKKRIRLDDVFKSQYRDELKVRLNEAARKKFRTNHLSDVLLVDEVEVTDNFYLTRNGITFLYAPYEIAPFVMGEPTLFLPFRGLKSILK